MNDTNKILGLLKEETDKLLATDPITEANAETPNPKYTRIQTILQNDIWNHAAIVRQLWGKDDATNRSLFGKKLNKDAIDGSTYSFDDDELNKIESILMDTSRSVASTFTAK